MPSIVDVGIQVLANHLQRVLELDQPTHRQILALHGDDHLVGGRQGVDREQSEARRRVDADEVVVVGDLGQRLLQRALAADHRGHRDLRAGEVDRGAGDVDLALADHLADRHAVHQDVVHRLLEVVRVDALGHRQVALRVHVDAEHAMPRLAEGDGEVEGRRRLGDAALLVGEGDDLGLLSGAPAWSTGSLRSFGGSRTLCGVFAWRPRIPSSIGIGGHRLTVAGRVSAMLCHWDEVEPAIDSTRDLAAGRRRRLGPPAGTERLGLSRWDDPAGRAGPMPRARPRRRGGVLRRARRRRAERTRRAAHPIAAGDVILLPGARRPHTVVAGDDGLVVLVFGSGSDSSLTWLPRPNAMWAGPRWLPLDGPEPVRARRRPPARSSHRADRRAPADDRAHRGRRGRGAPPRRRRNARARPRRRARMRRAAA